MRVGVDRNGDLYRERDRGRERGDLYRERDRGRETK